ncbi:hypothetical protein D9M69_573810 [compost metagenome]
MGVLRVCLEGVYGGDVDDTASHLGGTLQRQEVFDAGHHQVVGAANVDRALQLPVGIFDLQNGLTRIDAGAVHQHLNAPEAPVDVLDQRSAGLLAGDIAKKALGIAAGAVELVYGRPGRGLVDVDDGDTVALPGKQFGAGLAQATRTAGNDNNAFAHVQSSTGSRFREVKVREVARRSTTFSPLPACRHSLADRAR